MLPKLLIVDDSELIHQMYQLILAWHQFDIMGARSGQEALDILLSQGNIQLVVLDIDLPVMNGIQFMEKAVAIGIVPKLPIIVSSTEEKEERILHCMHLGARGYLKKPFDPPALYDLLNRVLQPVESESFPGETSWRRLS